MTQPPRHRPDDRPVLRTDRLVLRPPEAEDFAPFARFYTSGRGALVGGGEQAGTEAAWRSFAALSGHWWLHGYGWFIVLRRADGEVVGMTGLHHPPHHAEREIGWSLFTGTGEGLATEAARAARDWGRDRLRPARLVSYIDADNAASQRVARRLGAATDGARADHDPACEVWRHGEAP